ncbi:hypothetical protein SSX86_001190 [Deinandra increscens subsp. villosa]|uniref:Uncharacterized protein n=1 Tax=Deinandra increscens subsp. villosa TaxID=3103831 RepID=A0AAP0DUI5_9ASTR
MGGFAIRPPHHKSSSSTPMKSRRTTRRQTPGKGNLKKKNTTEAAVATEPPTTAAKNKNLAMGQVKILKRGEALKESPKSTSEIDVGSDWEVSEVPVPMRECYAGYGFGDSPSPSLLPLPRFFLNSCVRSRY